MFFLQKTAPADSNGRLVLWQRYKESVVDLLQENCEDLRVTSLTGGTLLTYTKDIVHVRDPYTLTTVLTLRTRCAVVRVKKPGHIRPYSKQPRLG